MFSKPAGSWSEDNPPPFGVIDNDPYWITIKDGPDGSAGTITPIVTIRHTYWQELDGGAAEGRPVHFEVSAPSAAQGRFPVYLKVEETAGQCVDNALERTHRVSFAPGVPAVAFSVPTVDDSTGEQDCTVKVSLARANGTVPAAGTTTEVRLAGSRFGYTIDTLGPLVNGNRFPPKAAATATVRDDDSVARKVSFVTGTRKVRESTAGRVDLVVAVDPAPSAPFELRFSLSGSATRGVDYTVPATVTVPLGAVRATIPVTIVDDTVEDSGEWVVVHLEESGGYVPFTPVRSGIKILNHEPGDGAPDWTDYQTVVDHLVEVRDNPKNTAVKGNPAHIRKWNRVLEAVGHDTGTGLAPMPASEIHGNAKKWPNSPFKAASVYLKSLEQPQQPQQQEPEIAVTAGSAVTEGGDAVFTLTATPAPAADLPVSVTVATDGDWGVTAGSRTVTIPASGSATLTLATTDDATDEPDGSVSVTVTDGTGYTVGSSASGTVSVQDDDDAAPACAARQTVVDYLIEVRDNPKNTAVKGHPVHVAKWNRVLEAIGHDTGTGLAPMPASEIHANAAKWPDSPFKTASDHLNCVEAQGGQDPDQPPQQEPEIAVSAGSAVTEGGDAVFTLTATPAPAADLVVSVTVATDGDWGVTAGSRTVTIPATGSATLTLATTDDATDEPNGSVSVTVTDGTGYTVGSSASATVSVQDDDDAAAPVAAVDPALVAEVRAMAAQTQHGQAHVERWRRVLVAFGVEEYPGLTPTTAAEAEANAQKYSSPLWPRIADALKKRETALAQQDPDQPPPQEPEITVSAGSAVTEGGDAVFTLTATPAPAADLAVSVTVATQGDYGITAGPQPVTLPTTGRATLTLATTDDEADEPDGAVTVTVAAGSGYTVGAAGSGTVAVRDDDLPPPVVTVSAGASIPEGGTAAFTLTTDRAPAADLAVTLTVAEAADGDFMAAADEGTHTVTILADTTAAAFTVATTDDATVEPDGAVTATVEAGNGYTVGAPASASVTVTDDDAAATAVLSVADATAKEGARLPMMPFIVRLSAPAPGPVQVHVSTRPSTPVSAQPGQDYAPGSYDLTFRVGETEKTVWIWLYDDLHDDGGETFEVVLSHARGAPIGDGVAVGTIENADPLPAAFLARFGRTLAQQTLTGLTGRLTAPRTPGLQGTLAGQTFQVEPAEGRAATPTELLTQVLAGVAQGFGTQPGSFEPIGPLADDPRRGALQGSPRLLTPRQALLGSRFTLTSQPDAGGGSFGFWGRAAQGYFDGAERGDGTALTLDGSVTTGFLGADYARGPWLLGVALTHSRATGTYAALGGPPPCPLPDQTVCDGAVRAGTGDTETTLTAAIPYAALEVAERLQLWGAGGYGAGDVTLKTMGARYEADTTWAMAAAGLRGALLPPTAGAAGPDLAVTSDAFWTRTASDRTRDLAASASQVTRLRLGLAGSWRMAVGTPPADARSGASLTPKLELGARQDGGDAETGLGVEIGGGVAWVEPALGLSLDLAGRTLLAHENDDLRDRGFSAALAFDPTPGTPRGPSLSLRQDVGSPATGGLDALFTAAPLTTRTGQAAPSRWGLEAAYGFPVFGGHFTGSPHLGVGLAPRIRDYRLGWRLTPEAASALALSLDLAATRQERDAAAPVHTVGVEVLAQW